MSFKGQYWFGLAKFVKSVVDSYNRQNMRGTTDNSIWCFTSGSTIGLLGSIVVIFDIIYLTNCQIIETRLVCMRELITDDGKPVFIIQILASGFTLRHKARHFTLISCKSIMMLLDMRVKTEPT